MHLVPIGWALRPVFLHECRQGGFANDGIEHLVDDATRMLQCSLGQFEQEGGFPVHALEVTEPGLFISLQVDRRTYCWSQAKPQHNRIPGSAHSPNQMVRSS